MIKNDPEDIAKFLKTADGLDKLKVGSYLSEGYAQKFLPPTATG